VNLLFSLSLHVWSLLSLHKREPSKGLQGPSRAFLVLSLTPALASSWRPCSSSFPTELNKCYPIAKKYMYCIHAKLLFWQRLPIAWQCRPLWVAVANSRGSKAGAAAAAATATLTLLWLKNLHKLLKVATGVLFGNISEGHFDASRFRFLLRCLLFLFLVHPQTLVLLINKSGFLMFRSLYSWRSFS